MAFVKLDDNSGSLPQEAQLIRSNYAHDNQVYLLNAGPGRYAVALAVRERQLFVTDEVHFPFSEELMKLTEVTLTPGAVVFMGAFTVDTSLSSSYSAVALKKDLNVGPPLVYLARPYQSDRGDKAREAFLLQMKKHFKDSAWADLIEKNLETLQNTKTSTGALPARRGADEESLQEASAPRASSSPKIPSSF